MAVKEYVDLVTNNLKPNFRLAEIGVFKGESAIEILPKLAEVSGTFVGVDSWVDNSEQIFLTNIEPWKDIVDIRAGISWEVAANFSDESFDMVYIDAGHRYSFVIRDIRAWLPKVKIGGILAGHDFNRIWDGSSDVNTDDDFSEQVHHGVSKAVREVFGVGGFQFTESLYPTCDTWWAIITENNRNV